jgi:hypothetical protein
MRGDIQICEKSKLYRNTNKWTAGIKAPIYLSVCLSVYTPTHVTTYPPTYQPTNLPTYLPTYPPTYPPTYLPTYPSTHLPRPTYLPISPTTHGLTRFYSVSLYVWRKEVAASSQALKVVLRREDAFSFLFFCLLFSLLWIYWSQQ